MTLSERIDKEYVEAYKARNSDKVGVLRLLKAAAKNRLVELKRPGGSLNDEEMLDVIIKQAKQRADSIEQYTAAHRKDLADKEELELQILKTYLPKMLEQDELLAAIRKIIKDTNACGMRDMGNVMREIMAKYAGQIDGKLASSLVRKELENK